MNKIFKEAVLWILILIPFAYLATIWKTLPEIVPTHFGLDGTPNGWSNKHSLIYIIGVMGLGIYVLMLLIPRFDPKKKIEQMGDKYYSIRLIMGLLISSISLYLLYVGNKGEINQNILIALIGAFFTGFGNFLQTVKPNYFIGIRTPWTLENETIWKRTHRLAGRIWMIGGLTIILMTILTKNNYWLGILFISITAILVIIPVAYSYIEFKKIQLEK